MRPDDIWSDAFGEQKGLIRSYLGPAAAHPGKKGKTPSIFRDVMKTHGHVVIEQIEFELPYHASWPPAALKQFMTGDRLDRKTLPEKMRAFAARAWRRPLDKEMAASIDGIFTEEFSAGSTELQALRNALAVVLMIVASLAFMLSPAMLEAKIERPQLEAKGVGELSDS